MGANGFPFLVNSIQKVIWEEVTESEIPGEVVGGITSREGMVFLYIVYFSM
jgi:hypothetical protein